MAKHCKDFLRVKKHARFRTDPALHGKQVAANDLPLDTPLPRGVRANTRPAPSWDASLPGACTSRFLGLWERCLYARAVWTGANVRSTPN